MSHLSLLPDTPLCVSSSTGQHAAGGLGGGGLMRPRSENKLSLWILEASRRVGKVQKPKTKKHKHPTPGDVEENKTVIDFKNIPPK